MKHAPLIKIRAATAIEICERFDLKKETRQLLLPGMEPGDFLAALLAKKHYVPGIDFVAHALAPREAAWWGCLCLQHACGNDLPIVEKAAFKAAAQWIIDPCEKNRAAARAPAETAGARSVGGALAAAVNQTGGNIAPANAPSIPPPPFAPARAIAGAVKMATTKCDPAKIVDTQRLFLELGLGVAEGRFMLAK
jgi:hypothetical protein